MPLSPSSIS